MIHIFPHLEYSIDSTKTSEDIYEILNSVTIPWGMVFPLSYGVMFVGEVNLSDFELVIYDKFGFRNGFRPVIEGTISTESELTVIDIKMRLRLSVLILFIITFGGCFLDGLFTVFTKGIDGVPMLIGAAAIFAFVQVIVRPVFHFSAKRAIKRLEELLK